MEIAQVLLKYGPMKFHVVETSGGFQAISVYHLTAHPTLSSKTLTNKSKVYKTRAGAEKKARQLHQYQVENGR